METGLQASVISARFVTLLFSVCPRALLMSAFPTPKTRWIHASSTRTRRTDSVETGRPVYSHTHDVCPARRWYSPILFERGQHQVVSASVGYAQRTLIPLLSI